MLDSRTLKTKQEHYRQVSERLREHYGYPDWRQHLPAVDELVSTILSQATSDTNRDKGYFALKERYPDWEHVRDAPVKEIEDTIRSAGLARQKAPRIKAALQYITDTVGEINLDFLETMDINEAKAWLTSIDGVGPKTAAIILLFTYNRAAFPVDTHVHRVTKRLGLIADNINAEKAHLIFEEIAPPENYYADHLNIIRHGREICKARNPRCEQCILTAYCRYYQNLPG